MVSTESINDLILTVSFKTTEILNTALLSFERIAGKILAALSSLYQFCSGGLFFVIV